MQAWLQMLVSAHSKELYSFCVGKNKRAAFYQQILLFVSVAVILFPTTITLQLEDFKFITSIKLFITSSV